MKIKSSAILIVIAFGLIAFLPKADAVVPPPDGCYPNFTTAEGCDTLNLLTIGAANTGLGWRSLFSDSTGSFNTGVGAGALVLNNGDSNTAVGTAAMLLNTTGHENTAVGTDALVYNDTGVENTALGAFALSSNTGGDFNTAAGEEALSTNTTGGQNTAFGHKALRSNVDGAFNTATGYNALISNQTGSLNTATGNSAMRLNIGGGDNTAVGNEALFHNTTGGQNTALGEAAGHNQDTGSGNVYIGTGVPGVAGESNACYIASIFGQTSSSGIPVLINANQKLGTTTSSKRFKEDIKPMNTASEALFSLRPVTFHYKKDIDPTGILQLGLVAEDVEEVNPSLVVRDKQGQPYSVRYDQVNAMMLNEFLKEHRKVEEQQAAIVELKSVVAQQQKEFRAAIAEQQKEMENVIARLKQQEAKIQKVNDRIALTGPTPQVVANNE